MDRTLYRARMKVSRDLLEDLLEALAVLDPSFGSWEDMDSGEAWVETFDADRTALTVRARDMADIAAACDGNLHAAEITALAEEDWTEAWKQYFHTTRVSPRIVVHPSWEPRVPSSGDIVIDIDPGMSFGTGLHPTTRCCLRALDRFAAADVDLSGWTMVDLGCGSGILSIAAAKLGFGAVHVLDHDPLAARIARENLALNGIPDDHVHCATADVLHDALPVGDFVVANILAPVLIEAARPIANALRDTPAAVLVLSGILEAQFAEVEQAYRAQGFARADTLPEAGWKTGCFRRTLRESAP